VAARNDDDLMRFIDGEMSSAEARQFEEKARGTADVEGKVAAVKQLGDVVRARYDAAADEAEPKFDALWARIEDNMVAPARKPAAAADVGMFAAMREWLASRRGYVMTGALSAVAAALLVIILRPAQVREVPGPKEIVEVPVEVTPALVHVKARAIEIEELETAQGAPDVLRIPSGDEDQPPTLVVRVPGLRSI
jgi:hypothetical protein